MFKKHVVYNVILDGLNEKASWYTIVTKINYERFVEDRLRKLIENNSLQDTILEVYCPIKENQIISYKNGKEKIKKESKKLYPNYIFIKTYLDPQLWLMLNNVLGVVTVLNSGGVPIQTGDKEINHIKEVCKSEVVYLNTKEEQNIKVIDKPIEKVEKIKENVLIIEEHINDSIINNKFIDETLSNIIDEGINDITLNNEPNTSNDKSSNDITLNHSSDIELNIDDLNLDELDLNLDDFEVDLG